MNIILKVILVNLFFKFCRELEFGHKSEDSGLEFILQSDGGHVKNEVRECDGRGSSFMDDWDKNN